MLLCVFVLLGFVTSPAITRGAQNGVFSCRRDELQCSDGSCIPFDGECATPDSAAPFLDPAICKLLQVSSPRCTPPTTTTTTTPRTVSKISEQRVAKPSLAKYQSQSAYSQEPLPPKHKSAYNLDPIPPKHESTYSLDPIQPKHEGAYSLDSTPLKHESAYGIDPIPPKYESAYNLEPIPSKQTSAYSPEPIPPKHESAYSLDPIPLKHESAYSLDPIPPKHESAYSLDPIPPKHESAYSLDPIPLKHESAYSLDPIPPKHESAYSLDSIPPKHESAYSLDPIPPKHESAYSLDPIPPKHESAYSLDPIPPKHESAYSLDPIPPKHESAYRLDPIPPKHKSAYSLDPIPPKHESAYSIDPTPPKHESAYSLEPSPLEYQSQKGYSAVPSTPEDQRLNDYNSKPSPVYQTKLDNFSVGSKNVLTQQNLSAKRPQPTESEHGTSTTDIDIVKACVLPAYPEHGKYEVQNVLNASPGQSFDSLALTVSCQRGYGMIEGDPNTTQHIYCSNGNWSQSLPKCVPYCRLPPDPSVHYMCEVPGTHRFEPCKYYVAPGTNVNPVCNSPIYYSTEYVQNMTCIDGTWDFIARCKPDCGRITPEGIQAIRGELPWHAGIYLKTTLPYTQVCGGSLIATNVIISAAHCFWKDGLKKQAASDYAVAVGKIYRSWNNSEDVDAQKSDVKEIKIPELFQGSEANFQDDIAILILATPAVYKTSVRPVCLNFDTSFESQQLRDGSLGKVAGWGLTATNGKAPQVLKVVDMPFINVDTCINTVPLSFRENITSDKLCAGYTNDTAMCSGDSGGGLAFPALTELNTERYYLRGVVSTAPNQDGKLCNDNTYTIFTRISKHADFIKDSIAASLTKKCPLLNFQCADGTCLEPRKECNGIPDCKDGSDELEALCGVQKDAITSTPPPPPSSSGNSHSYYTVGNEMGYHYHDCGVISTKNKTAEIGAAPADYGDVPWHVGIYKKSFTPTSYSKISGGTLIFNDVVICASDRLIWIKKNYRLSHPHDLAVAAGKFYESWDDQRDVNVQKSDVKNVKLPHYSTGGEDFAIVFLVDPLVNTATVTPVCLVYNFSKTFEELQSGKLAKVAGWSRKTGAAEVLHMPFIDNNVCRNTLLTASRRYVTESHLCTAYTGPHFWTSDYTGSGLVIPVQDGDITRYSLVGIMSSKQNCYNQYKECAHDANSYIIFTNVSTFINFIYETVTTGYSYSAN